jgi:hypothetical protein
MATYIAPATSTEAEEWTRLLLQAARTLAGAPEGLITAITVVLPAQNLDGAARLELERLAEYLAGEYRLNAETVESTRSLVMRITRAARCEEPQVVPARQGQMALRDLWRRIIWSKREDNLS